MATQRGRVVGAIAIASLVLGGGAAIAAGNVWLPASASSVLRAFVFCGGILGIVCAGAAWMAARGVSTGWRATASITTLVGTTALAGAVLLAINMAGDGGPGAPHAARIVKKSKLSNVDDRYDRTSIRNTVSVASWLEEGKLIEVHVVGVAAWNALQPGDMIQVMAHEGRLGWPWVEHYAAPPAQ